MKWPSDRTRDPQAVAGIVVAALLCAVCFGLAFRSGAYSPADWLPFLIGVAALAVAVGVTGPTARSSRFQKVLLALFAALAVWTAASIFWATSLGNTWEEINRTLFYAVATALTFCAVRWAGPAGFFISGRFNYLSLRYCSFAAGSADLETLTARAQSDAALDPTSVAPFAVRASAHNAAATEAPEGSPARVEQLKLAAAAWVDATEREPGGWLYFYLAADAFLGARDAAQAVGAISEVEGLARSARTYLDVAKRLNPLSPQIQALESTF